MFNLLHSVNYPRLIIIHHPLDDSDKENGIRRRQNNSGIDIYKVWKLNI